MTHAGEAGERGSNRWHTPEERDRWLGHLARAAQRGDRATQDALWDAVGQRLIRIAERRAWFLPEPEREDVAQEAFPLFLMLIYEWKSPPSVETGFAQYLFGMFNARIRNVVRDGVRARRVTSLARQRESEAPVVESDDSAVLATFFASLTPHERHVLHLRVREGLALDQIAARLGVTPRSVSRTWNEMLKRLRRLIAA